MRIFLDLVVCLTDGNATTLEFNMYNRHAVDEQHQIATTVI